MQAAMTAALLCPKPCFGGEVRKQDALLHTLNGTRLAWGNGQVPDCLLTVVRKWPGSGVILVQV